MERAYVVPAKGAKIYLPNGDLVPEEGRDLELTTYVRRRIKDGGLVVGKPPKAEKPIKV